MLVPMAVLTVVLAACGSSEPDSSGASALAGANGGSGVVGEWGESYPLPDCTGQDPGSCSYDGFDPLVEFCISIIRSKARTFMKIRQSQTGN